MDLTDSYLQMFPEDVLGRYDMREVRNASAVVANTNPTEFRELVTVLRYFALTKEDILRPGKNEGQIAKRLNRAFRDAGWREGRYDTKITSLLRLMPYKPSGEKRATVVETEVLNEGYKVDNVKGEVALDVEWNAKDGNLDRDVSAYRALYEAGIVAAGVVLTRTMSDLRELGRELGRPRFLATTTTTNLGKLEPRLTRGDAGGCPLLAIAITARCYQS
ncbi:MAG TPA: BglII/BstYI family type II restriction endonuclease [Solirubrobacterales bacterium]|nr:BglII/BstYI family type II restriction endonuclease [Solirubrobacterales bacterium]